MAPRKKIRVHEIEPGILHAKFETHYDLAMAFCRLQEWGECSYKTFHKKLFSLEEFMRWYSLQHGGVFTYSTDWDGFNVKPDSIAALAKMKRVGGKYAPTEIENELLMAVKAVVGSRKKYSLIGTSNESHKDTLTHEIAHGRWYANSAYYDRMNEIVVRNRHKTKTLVNWLAKSGYHKDVHDDETHAYILTGWPPPTSVKFKPTKGLMQVKAEMKAAYRELVAEGHIRD